MPRYQFWSLNCAAYLIAASVANLGGENLITPAALLVAAASGFVAVVSGVIAAVQK